MSKTIEGVPEFLTREQYLALLAAVGFDPADLKEIRYAADGVHAIVFERSVEGRKIPTVSGYAKHRVFIPVRDDDSDKRTTRVTTIKAGTK